LTREDASRITQPTLAILGANTAPTFPERLQLLISWLSNVEPFELPDATHLLHLQNPRGMADALDSFYARHPLTASTASRMRRAATRPRPSYLPRIYGADAVR
jgi:hypothetical protein